MASSSQRAEVGGDLVVAAAPGVQFAAHRAGDLGQAALDGGMDVLIGGDVDELARADFAEDVGQPFDDLVLLVEGDHLGFHQRFGPGDRAAHVEFRQAPVKRQRGVVLPGNRVQPAGKPSAP